MGRSLWDTASGRDRRWSKRGGGYPSAPGYARVVILLLAVALVGTLAWQGFQSVMHPAPKFAPVSVPGNANYTARGGTAPGAGATPAWQADVADALQAATKQGTAGNVTAAEVEVDRAASIVMSARMQGQKPAPDFYVKNLGALDRALRTQADNARMLEHVTLARMELADLRSSDDGSGGIAANADEAPDMTSYPGASATPISNVGPDAEARHAKSIPGHVVMASPRAVGADAVVDPGTAGGNYLDATLMPETSEVLLPPATRKLADGVRVEGLMIEGASQTLDGVRWRNVTFVGMRLRYEGGEISLQNVKFVRCRFGFTTDERGAKLADAIALGKTSIAIP
jgi:hypothetical protein